ncbi:MAG: hypothetical protein HY019_15365 [Aquabacterium sp.]|uniref:hypothetical protein n=1 Tax=Aquabacterium sp. TaxID=1872578 RepID=UPI0025C067DA|nr:hypothetical protein [Aquabacterium sp.]MBI3383382.1 hypothetical protein [Aquabacterium sp.]
MKALGLLSLLLALLIVAVLTRKQLSATHQGASGVAASAASSAGIDLPKVDNADDARRVQQRVQDDMNRLTQGRASEVDRGVEGADKP